MNYCCIICNKYYSSYQSLWIHNKKFHKENVKIVKENVKSLTCDFCNKIFNNRPAKSIHKKKCKPIENFNKINELEEKNKELEQIINELKNQVSLIIKEKGKIYHKTLQK